MAGSGKVQVISTKYFMCINQEYYVVYVQNIKFVWLILWPGRAYTDDTYATKPESWSHIRIHFMNHDYIGSFWQCQMSQKAHSQTELNTATDSGFGQGGAQLWSTQKIRNLGLRI